VTLKRIADAMAVLIVIDVMTEIVVRVLDIVNVCILSFCPKSPDSFIQKIHRTSAMHS
jgi:hypothetical protein